MEKALITGATGLVGCGLACRLLSAGDHVTTLVRAADGAEARRRQLEALREQYAIDEIEPPADMADRVVVHPIDITDRAALLDDDFDGWAVDFDVVYHSAACVNFVDTLQCNDVNVGGTRNVLDAVRRLKPKRFNHVSTAFVAGGHDGEIREDVMPPRKTLNAYEDTKYEAELLVRNQDEIPYTIHRPSIIVGNGRDGRIRSFKNFYLIVRYFGRLAKKNKPPLRFPGRGLGRINLVPLDWVVDATARVGSLPSEGKTYHIVNDEPPTTEAIVRSIEAAVGRQCVEFLGERPEFNDDELATQTRFQEFMPYFFGSPTFELDGIRRVMGDLGASRLPFDALVRVARYFIERELEAP